MEANGVNRDKDTRKIPPALPGDTIELTAFSSTIFPDAVIHGVLGAIVDALGAPGSPEREIGLDIVTRHEPRLFIITDFLLQAARLTEELERELKDQPDTVEMLRKMFRSLPEKTDKLLKERRPSGRS